LAPVHGQQRFSPVYSGCLIAPSVRSTTLIAAMWTRRRKNVALVAPGFTSVRTRRDRMSEDAGDDREELAATADELASVLADLRTELDRQRERRDPPEPPQGPLGLPRPPSPREVLAFADEVAIPAAIAVLEANVRVLEALQRGIRMAETGDRARTEGERAADRATAAGRETLSRLEGALADLQRAVEGGGLPENETARELLADARRLRDEVEANIEAAESPASETADAAASDEDADDAVDVDVEGELETLKDRYGEEGDDASDDGADDEGDAGTT
jgi:hypothetical protein